MEAYFPGMNQRLSVPEYLGLKKTCVFVHQEDNIHFSSVRRNNVTESVLDQDLL